MSVNPITKEIMENCFVELGKAYKKQYGKYANIEIILVGGAAILAKHNFRNTTMDIDAYIGANASIKELVREIGDNFGLANDWLNQDFIHTSSFTPKLRQYSIHYKTYSNVLEIRTLSDPFLIATKLMAGRGYKNDLSDIVGILIDSIKEEDAIKKSDIDAAFIKLYGDIKKMPALSSDLINILYPDNSDLPISNIEQYAKKSLEFENKSKMLLLHKQNEGTVLDEEYVDKIVKFLHSEEFNKPEQKNVYYSSHKHR